MTREEYLSKWQKGYIVLNTQDWLKVATGYPGVMLSPGGVASMYGITRSSVWEAAKRGRIYYFVSRSRNTGERGNVLVADYGLEEAFKNSRVHSERLRKIVLPYATSVACSKMS